MKKFLVFVIAGLVLGAFCFAGCSKKEEEPETEPPVDEEIVGTWMEDYWDSGYTFAEDGTGTDIFWSQPFHFEAVDGNLKITYDEGLWAEKEFTYVVSGNSLTLTEVINDPANDSASPGSWTYTKKS